MLHCPPPNVAIVTGAKEVHIKIKISSWLNGRHFFSPFWLWHSKTDSLFQNGFEFVISPKINASICLLT